MATREYPQFHTTVVGLSPSKMKQFSPADMDALCSAFQALTLQDPLGEHKSPALLWEEWKKSVRTLESRIDTSKIKPRFWNAPEPARAADASREPNEETT